jgi:translation initiation factor 2-alpha kinase 4
MAPTHPGTKPKGKTSAENGYPGLSPQKAGEAKSKYEEIQEDELLALESIYGDDFHKIETKSTAWKVRTSRTASGVNTYSYIENGASVLNSS